MGTGTKISTKMTITAMPSHRRAGSNSVTSSSAGGCHGPMRKKISSSQRNQPV
jgi:hypothetical protein